MQLMRIVGVQCLVFSSIENNTEHSIWATADCMQPWPTLTWNYA